MVPPPGGAFAAISSHLRHAHNNLNIRLTPANDLTVWSRYLITEYKLYFKINLKYQNNRTKDFHDTFTEQYRKLNNK